MRQELSKLSICKGNITKMGVDAIVNAANPSLLGGGGVDGAIHAAAGPELREECRAIGGCSIGDAKITMGYNLPAPFVIHTVGPVWHGGDNGEARNLARCYYNALRIANEYQLATIAFPAISTGAYGYPKYLAAEIAIKTTVAFLQENNQFLRIYFVAHDDETLQCYEQVLAALRV